MPSRARDFLSELFRISSFDIRISNFPSPPLIQRALHAKARLVQDMGVNHRRAHVFLPREIVSESILDITLAPRALQIRLPLSCVRLIEAPLPIDQFERGSAPSGRNGPLVLCFQP